ncbi:hypothetical protein AAVH_21981 [Aphelenchoides avenae]|nr:hypothetical protein AAVH_21981 [Aphelenchus avenae]
MGVSTCIGTILAAILWWVAAVRSANISHTDGGETSLIDRIEEIRTQAIELLNEADGYKMATMVSDNAADTLKFFGDLGPLFRNGTLATYMCRVDHRLAGIAGRRGTKSASE